jgi:hypothetical protein
MQLYTVRILANLYQNNGEKEYCQKYMAYYTDTDDEASIHYQCVTAKEYPFLVLERSVIAESGCGAIFKLQKWQNEGLDNSFLTSREEAIRGLSQNYTQQRI